jgi:hypothetical protein
MRVIFCMLAGLMLTFAGRLGFADETSDNPQTGTPADFASQGAPDSQSGEGMIEAIEAGSQVIGKRDGEFVVVPLPFRNALIGAGLVVGAGYLYRDASAPKAGPPSMLGVGGMYAEQDTWAALAAHRGYWAGNTWRTTAGVAIADINYSVTLGDLAAERQVAVNQAANAASIEGARRFGKHTWVGLSAAYANTDVTAVGFLVLDDIALADLGLSVEWDTRDDTFAPRTGALAALEIKHFDEALGSDNNFTRINTSYNGYRALSDRQVIAYRIAAEHVEGDAPFFALPWLGSGCDLRGYTPGTYIGRSLLAAQAEWRLQLSHRWGMVAFGGVASVGDRDGQFKSGDALPAGGVGLRYRVADKFKVNVRADMAWGRDDSTFTLSVGEAF